MSSRALSSATVMLLIGCFAATQAHAQAQNLEAGKSPSQIFAGTCTACHKSPRGLLKTVPAGSLTGFLRQHYTTSSDMASLLSAFLVSNGAADTRYQAKPDKDAKPEAKPVGPAERPDRQGHRLGTATPEPAKPVAEPQQAAKPDADGLPPQAEPGHKGRAAKRLPRPGEAPDVAKPADAEAPAQAASERGPGGRTSAAKQRLSKRGKPGAEEPPKTDAAKPDATKSDAAKSDAIKDEPAKGEAVKEDKPASETARDSGSKPEGDKPPGEARSEATKADAPKQTGGGDIPMLRADPVPPVTPAAAPVASTAASGAAPERTPAVMAPAAVSAPPPASQASAPPAPPLAPAGPPVPPISQ